MIYFEFILFLHQETNPYLIRDVFDQNADLIVKDLYLDDIIINSIRGVIITIH